MQGTDKAQEQVKDTFDWDAETTQERAKRLASYGFPVAAAMAAALERVMGEAQDG